MRVESLAWVVKWLIRSCAQRTRKFGKLTHFDLEDQREINLHFSLYGDFFLLRLLITIDGQPAVIQRVNEEPALRLNDVSASLLEIFQQAVSPVLTKHGVYKANTFYYEQVPLFSMEFQSRSSLKQISDGQKNCTE